jgi:hypothetical protein
VLLDQSREANPAAALAAMAIDFQHRQLALKLAKRDWAAAAHCSFPDSPWSRLVAIFRSMPPPDLTPEEYAEIVRLVRAAIDGDRYPLSVRARRLKSILAKLDPAPSATVTPYPAPRPSAEPSFLYAKLRGVRRRR